MSELTRTIIVPSVKLAEKRFRVFKELKELYKQVLLELVEYGFRNSINSFTRLKRDKYRELRKRFPHLPATIFTRLVKTHLPGSRVFNKLKKKGLARSKKPEVNKISIWLDDHLWRRAGYMTILIYTHGGWIPVELVPHKLYWKHINGG